MFMYVVMLCTLHEDEHDFSSRAGNTFMQEGEFFPFNILFQWMKQFLLQKNMFTFLP